MHIYIIIVLCWGIIICFIKEEGEELFPLMREKKCMNQIFIILWYKP